MRRTTVSMIPTDPTTAAAGERLRARVASKLAVLVPPWVMLGLTAGAGAVSHAVWGDPASVTWVACTATAATMGLTGLTWAITHARRLLGRVHATATTAATGTWVTVVTVTGLGPDVVTGALWWGGGFLALSWNLRAVIRHLDPDQQTGGGDALAALFDRAKDQANLKGARARAKEVTDRKIKGQLALPPGQATVDDAQRAIGRLESGMQVPPGTIALAADPDRADLAEITLSDPRVLRNPILWPGPSRPGGSIDDPIRVGVWQDGDDCEYSPRRHQQKMGTSGSGKSFGGAWNDLAEIMTRTDAAIFAIDTSKDEQTLGPLREGLARLDTDHKDAVRLLRAIHERIPQRTKWLGQNGHSNWEKGCGLTYWILWIEEFSKFMAGLSSKDEERLEQVMKEARSAGVTVVLSLQRSDYTQMPTLIRGQLAKMCFGVTSGEDAKFGLSVRQQKVDTVEPEAWEANYPGMAYLDAPGVSEKHAVMPLRTYDWGKDARALMAAHAHEYAQANKDVDEFTAELINLPTTTATTTTSGTAAATATTGTAGISDTGTGADRDLDDDLDDFTDDLDDDPDQGDEEGFDVVDDVLTEAAEMDPDLADPDPAITAGVRSDMPIQQPTEQENAALSVDPPAQQASPTEAREALRAWLEQRAATGQMAFKATDDGLAALRQQLGLSRQWTYKALQELVDTGRLALDNRVYTITDHEPGHEAAA
ncbi:hypothetical protein [Actinophytocola sp.]|uniref:hypothetical protein n=1 Tax=Actinophytocola sp. TaxID=1872138 RepID=UPI002ED30503